MKDEDIYCLFGNMLDNAIEYVMTVEEKEKRFIRLFVKTNDNIKVIHQENYFDGRLQFSDGLPQTTKSDRINHGFGVKSIAHIVKKYGGELSVAVDGELFKMDIVLTK